MSSGDGPLRSFGDRHRQHCGSNPTNEQFVTNLYAYVMHRAPDPDPAAYGYWVDLFNRHLISNIDTLVQFSESPENQTNVIGVIQNGIDLFA